jgi:hypothetical protein
MATLYEEKVLGKNVKNVLANQMSRQPCWISYSKGNHGFSNSGFEPHRTVLGRTGPVISFAIQVAAVRKYQKTGQGLRFRSYHSSCYAWLSWSSDWGGGWRVQEQGERVYQVRPKTVLWGNVIWNWPNLSYMTVFQICVQYLVWVSSWFAYT